MTNRVAMKVYIPFKPDRAKTRLSRILSVEEREKFTAAMLGDVYSAVERTNEEPVVLSTRELTDEDFEETGFEANDFEVEVSDGDLTPAVNSVLRQHRYSKGGVGVVMADLALSTPESLSRLFEKQNELVIVPGRGGGTNAFVSRSPDFKVDYHGTSFLDHLEIASSNEINFSTLDSYRLSTDIDEPDDLVEVLIHGKGESKKWLKERFEIGFDGEKRVEIYRKQDNR